MCTSGVGLHTNLKISLETSLLGLYLDFGLGKSGLGLDLGLEVFGGLGDFLETRSGETSIRKSITK